MILCSKCGKLDQYVILEKVATEKLFTADGWLKTSKKIKYTESEKCCPYCHRKIKYFLSPEEVIGNE